MNLLAVSKSIMTTKCGIALFGKDADESYWKGAALRVFLNLMCFLVSSLEVDLLDFIGFVGGFMIFLISFLLPVEQP